MTGTGTCPRPAAAADARKSDPLGSSPAPRAGIWQLPTGLQRARHDVGDCPPPSDGCSTDPIAPGQLLSGMPAQLQGALSCALASFDALADAEREQLVDTSLLADLEKPIDPARLAGAFAREINQRVGIAVFGDPTVWNRNDRDATGSSSPDGETFEIQLPIFSLNGLRTNALRDIGAGVFAAALAIGLKDLLALGLAHLIVLLIARRSSSQ
jgi:hypothetical protein